MTFVQNSLFFPLEIQVDVFNFVLSEEGNLSCRQVCKGWRAPIDIVIKKRWDDLIAMYSPTDHMEHLFGLQDQCPDDFNYLQLFRALQLEWRKKEVAELDGELKITTSYYRRLSCKLIDRDLMNLWDKIRPKVYAFSPHVLEPGTIRAWMRYSRTEKIRASIKSINLSHAEISSVPAGICMFPKLQAIDLSHNHMDALPSFLGHLKNLKILKLRGNNLREFPKDFTNWIHIDEIDLRDNPLNVYGQSQVKRREMYREFFRLRSSSSDGFLGRGNR